MGFTYRKNFYPDVFRADVSFHIELKNNYSHFIDLINLTIPSIFFKKLEFR